MMDSNEAYARFRAQVESEAKKIRRPLEIAQYTLRLKAIIVEAMDGKHDGLFTFRAGDKFGFSEGLVNQAMQFAANSGREGIADNESEGAAWRRGYEQARIDFAKATGLYTEQDLD